MDHLQKSELQSFLQGKMPPAALLECDDHLAACPRCRERLGIEAGLALSKANVKALLQSPLDHIEYEQLQRMVDNEPVPSAAVEHVAECLICSQELVELREFANKIASMPRSASKITSISGGRRLHIPHSWFALAAVLVLAVAAGLFWVSLTHRTPAAVASLSDGGGHLSLDRAGKLHGADGLPEADRHALQAAMLTGRIDGVIPSKFTGRRTETMLGAPTPAADFNVLSPVDRVLIDDKVLFRWEPVVGASMYRVTVFDPAYRKVAESPAIPQTDWQMTTPLPRGVTYTWTVTAQKGNGTVRAPVPPQPEAVFRVASQDEAATISELEQTHPSDHLLLAVLYARAGALSEARDQLDLLAKDNPNSALVPRLKNSLAQASQAASPTKTNPAQ